MAGVLIVAIVFGAIVAMQWIKLVQRERELEGKSIERGSMGISELEERMQQAVTAAVEPLRDQIAALEQKVDRLAPERLLEEGERRGSRIEDRAVERSRIEDRE